MKCLLKQSSFFLRLTQPPQYLARSIKSKQSNYYRLLQVEPSATAAEIKSSYYNLVKKYHPDLNGQNKQFIKVLNEAYDVLSNTTKRNDYDQKMRFNQIMQDSQPFGGNQWQQPKQKTNAEANQYYQQPNVYKSKQRYRNGGGLGQMLMRSFLFGLIITGIFIIVLGDPERERQRSRQHSVGNVQSSKSQFQLQFQNSLMKPKSTFAN